MAPRSNHEPVPDRDDIGGPQDFFYTTGNTRALPYIVRGEGIHLWDDVGHRYIDAVAGAICNQLGQGNRSVLQAMMDQGLEHTFSYVRVSRHHPNIALARRIAELAGEGFERVHFSTSGSEANEMAIKFLRQHAVARGETERRHVISCMPSYHGATLATMGWTGDEELAGTWSGMTAFSTKIPAPLSYRPAAGTTPEDGAAASVEALERAIVETGPEKVLAFIVEPVGGVASGANVPHSSFFDGVRDVCSRHGVHLVFDEIMSACRTGTFLACHHWPQARPDIVVLAKGLGAGYTPLSAMLAPAHMVDELAETTGFNLSHTYNANPISCAGGLAVLDEMARGDLVAAAGPLGNLLRRRLLEVMERSPLVGDVRGLGLLQAFEIVLDKETRAIPPADAMVSDRLRIAGQRHGLMLYARRQNRGRFGEWSVVAPPLVITEDQLDDMVVRIEAALRDVAEELHREGYLA